MRMIVMLLVSAYIAGSIPFGVIIGRLLKGVDIRTVGSGNIGAANAFRTLGPVAGTLVLLIDIAKGFIPVFIAFKLAPAEFLNVACVLVGFFAILGHNYSIFLKFKGGKGIATSLGVFLCLSWQASLIAVAVYILVVISTRISSLGSLSGTLAIPVLMYLFKAPFEFTLFAVLAAVFAFYKHKENIKRLIKKEELKVG